MLDESRFRSALDDALACLLRPLVRLLLRHSVPFQVFEEAAKKAYVDVAMTEFAVEGRKPTQSRASVLTGLTRKDVRRLVAAPSEAGTGAAQYNRAVRVLGAWVRESALRGGDGQPRSLPMEGEASFAQLVHQHSGDMPVRAVLDELQRVGAVRLDGQGHVELLQRGFVPRQGQIEKLGILGRDVAELIATIDHNIEHGAEDPRFQRKVAHVGIPRDLLPEFRRLSAQQSQTLLESFDAWLSRHDLRHRLADGDSKTVPTAQVSVGIYYFEQNNGATPAP